MIKTQPVQFAKYCKVYACVKRLKQQSGQYRRQISKKGRKQFAKDYLMFMLAPNMWPVV